ncbi:IS3 family transposase [Legionella londiniensis]|uniref:IS3 family transposase n=1 Tax=Legionella londiniensis TaxID=45068 RepID=UPI000E1C242F|nr:IS3 family transposase [Legionella londiniensis]
MAIYSPERKESILKKLLPPVSRPVAQLAREEGISEQTLYNWRNQLKAQGYVVPTSGQKPDDWSVESKFAVVIETASLSEAELSRYCREKGLLVEQVREWRAACIMGNMNEAQRKVAEKKQVREDKKRIKQLERELSRKEKALAEAAALLVLRKKLRAYYGEEGRGQLTPVSERTLYLGWFDEAVAAGARREKAAQELELPLRTLRRWRDELGMVVEDKRPAAVRPEPSNKLSEAERAQILATCNSEDYASLPPSQIVPRLADKGIYLASESTMYRVLKAANQQHHRGKSKAAQRRAKPTSYSANAPNQVWCWDISYMPSGIRGQYWYLYAVIDIYSRKLVAWEVHDRECSQLASELIQRALLREQCLFKPLVLHSDNGSPMKGSTLRVKLQELGITTSYSRPRVSNDNAFAESLFKTVKYCPQWPSSGFATVEDAREWMLGFTHFYNHEHRHSGIRFVTPAQRHNEQDHELLAKRKIVYEYAKALNPQRWGCRATRNWNPIGAVNLNPDREIVTVQAAA